MTKTTEQTILNVIQSASFETKLKGYIKELFDTAIQEIYKNIDLKIEDAVKERNGEIEASQQEIIRLNNELKASSKSLDELEQYSRRNCLLIAGIDKRDNESTDAIVLGLTEKLKLDSPITRKDIDTSHRLPNDKIIVKFVSRNNRDMFYAKRKDLGQGIYVSESLTKARQELLFNCRKFRRDGKIKQCWSTNGVVKVKLNDDNNTSVNDLKHLHSLCNVWQFTMWSDTVSVHWVSPS